MQLSDQFVKFAQVQLEISDTDPHVQVMTKVSDKLGLSLEERLWYGILYMGFYQDGSALASMLDPEVRARRKAPLDIYPISYQRRNLFGGRINDHFKSVYAVESLERMFDVHTWIDLIARLEMFYGNGRWASYTTGELLTKIALPHVKPDTAEIGRSSGPKQGLQFLGITSPVESDLFAVRDALAERGVVGDVEKIESVVCNWSRMVKGDFYLGHNLDRQHDRVRRVEREFGADMALIWEARAEVFPHEALAEKTQLWPGVDKERKKIYRDSGVVLNPTEMR